MIVIVIIVVIVNHNYMNHHDNVDDDDCDQGATSRRAGEGLVARTKTTSATSGLFVLCNLYKDQTHPRILFGAHRASLSLCNCSNFGDRRILGIRNCIMFCFQMFNFDLFFKYFGSI